MTPPSDDAGSARQAITSTRFNVVRLALLSGVLLFGGIAWLLTRREGFEPSLDADADALIRYVFYGAFFVAAVGIALVRPRAQRAETPQQRVQFSIIGYALAESVALFGAVYLLLTGTATFFMAGLLLFLVAFLLFPASKA